MKDLLEILTAARAIEQTGGVAALATVVKTTGSVYRRAGARMLITADNRMIGAISGGCLESDVFERAQNVMRTGDPITITYDSQANADIVWGLGLGCNGSVTVLIERVPASTKPDGLAFLKECIDQHRSGVMATVFSVENQAKVKGGIRLVLRDDETVVSGIHNPRLAKLVLDDATKTLRSQESVTLPFQLPEGRIEAFIEWVQPQIRLLVCGAGYDAVPLVRFAKDLGWHITVADHRPGFARADRFPEADEVWCCTPEALAEKSPPKARTVAVLMTHNFQRDAELLRTLARKPLSYLGLLGPKRRTDQLLEELSQAGISLTEAERSRIFGPIGLDIGAETPEEIALSILAEIRAVLNSHPGGLLRDRKGPIH
ncbi:MAG: XdhC family protein [Blastocatellia bacterium]|nr:XdhC family protein [Blastocatellia bacterium]